MCLEYFTLSWYLSFNVDEIFEDNRKIVTFLNILYPVSFDCGIKATNIQNILKDAH